MTVACPRHGVIAAAADTPCPDCGVAVYDLADRTARDLVRANRFSALHTRRMIFTLVTFAVGAALAFTTHGPVTFMNVNLLPLFVGVVLGRFFAEPVAKLVESKPALRALDSFLDKNRI